MIGLSPLVFLMDRQRPFDCFYHQIFFTPTFASFPQNIKFFKDTPHKDLHITYSKNYITLASCIHTCYFSLFFIHNLARLAQTNKIRYILLIGKLLYTLAVIQTFRKWESKASVRLAPSHLRRAFFKEDRSFICKHQRPSFSILMES